MSRGTGSKDDEGNSKIVDFFWRKKKTRVRFKEPDYSKQRTRLEKSEDKTRQTREQD